MCFILSALNVTGVLLQAIEIIFEAQMKKNNEKKKLKKKSFELFKQVSFLPYF